MGGRRPFVYAFAVLATVLIVALGVFLGDRLGDQAPLMLLVPAVLASAYFGGFGPGAAATALCAVGASIFLLRPLGSTAIAAPVDQLRLGLFVGVGVLISALLEQMHRTRRQRDALLAQIKLEQERLNAVLQQMPSGVAIAEAPSGRLLFHNEEAIRLLRHPLLTSHDVSGYAQYGALCADGLPYPPERYPIARALSGELIHNEEMLYRRGDRTIITLSVNAAPIRHAGGRIAFAVSTFHDVSAQKQAEREREQLLDSERAARSEAERAARVKDEFVATLSHELRTPLNAILGWAHLLARGAPDQEKLARGLAVIERNARSLVRMVEDLLDVSRILAGKLRLEIQPVDVASHVEDVVASLGPAIDARRIRLTTELEPGVEVRADPVRLRQIVWNLVSNAVKFTPPGGSVQVIARRQGDELKLMVRDTGQGIPPDFLPHVFTRFRQADASITRRHGGLGLGLSIVKFLAELHGGAVWAESAGEGRGATFTVRLPVAPPSTHAPARRGGDGARKQLGLAGLKVLVVDDDEDALELAKRVLEESLADVVTAGSAGEALEELQRSRPDVLVSDIGMPGGDGYSLIRDVRTLDRVQGQQTPAAALTAYARPEDRARALEAGFQLHVAKPFEPAELISVVAALAGRTIA